MSEINNPKLTKYSRKLRKGMTPEERKLWYAFLRKIDVTIHRQKVFGKYILDFYCASAKIAIELDGSQHYSGTVEENDLDRDAYLKNMGITVLRYSNREVNYCFDEVCSIILNELSKRINIHFKE